MTIKDLAMAAELSSVMISQMEFDRAKTSLPTLRRLAKLLDVPIAFLGCFETLSEKTLGQRIMKARLIHGMTREELALNIEVDPKSLRNWEQDKHKPIPRYLNALMPYLTILDS